MAVKSDREPKFPKKESVENNSASKKPSAKPKKQLEDADEKYLREFDGEQLFYRLHIKYALH